MRFRNSLILAAFLLVGRAEAQTIVCPNVDFAYEVGSRVTTLRWEDPPDSVRSRITLSLKKVGRIPCPFDSASGESSCTAEDSLSWRNTSLPTIGGQYLGGCDLTYRFRNLLERRFFATTDTIAVPSGWTGTSVPVFSGSFDTVSVDMLDFRFTVTTGGTIGSAEPGAVLEWIELSDSTQGAVSIPSGYLPGAILELIPALGVGFTAGGLVAGETFALRTVKPLPAIIEGLRPTSAFEEEAFKDTLYWPDDPLPIGNGLTLALSPGLLHAYDAAGDTVAVFRLLVETFDGFRVYRSDISDLNRFAIVREFNACRRADSTFFLTREHEYVDSEVHNGFPYRYYVTCYDTLSHNESEALPTPTLYPRTQPSDDIADIHVVPNPYKRRAAWEEGGEPKIQFVNVPVGATIRIYTSAGSLVREIGPDEVSRGCGASATRLPGCVNWDLRNGQSVDVVSGIYIYQADSPGLGSTVGKFMVAR